MPSSCAGKPASPSNGHCRADDDDRYAVRRSLQESRKLAWEFAKILNEEARELEAAGVDIIQFDGAFNVFFDEVNDWGVATLERAIEGLKCETAVHICYGYGIKANTDWKKTLGSEWRQYEEAFPKLQNPVSTWSRWNVTTRAFPWI